MRDLPSRLENMADEIKYRPESVDDMQMDVIRGMLREAAGQLGTIDTLLRSDLQYQRREGEIADVTLKAEMDMEELSRLLEMIAERI